MRKFFRQFRSVPSQDPPHRYRPPVAAFATGFFLLGLSVLCLRSYLVLAHLQEWRHNYAEQNGLIGFYDERLTMLARLAAASGDLGWESHYRTAERELTEVLVSAKRLTDDFPGEDGRLIAQQIAETSKYNDALVSLENACFDHLRAANRPAAMATVLSPEYASLKQKYAAAAVASRSTADRIVAGMEERWRFYVSAFSVALLIAFFLSFGFNIHKRASMSFALSHAERLADVARRTKNAVIVTDRTGHIEWVNEGFERITGYTLAEVVGVMHGTILHGPRTDPEERKKIRLALQTGTSTAVELVKYAKNGNEYTVTIEIEPRHDCKGGFCGFMAIETDVTEQRRAQEAVRGAEKFLRRSLDAMDAHAAIVDSRGVIHTVNTSWRNYNDSTGTVPSRPVEGVDYLQLLQHPARTLPEGESLARELRRALNAEDTAEDSVEPVTYAIEKAGHSTWFEASVNGFSVGSSRYAIVIHKDVTHQINSTRAMAEDRERLQLALSGGDLGWWDWNPITNEFHYNDRWATMLGVRVEELSAQFSEWADRVHPDDVAMAMTKLNRHLRDESPIYECTIRMRHGDGTWRWILDRGKVVARGADGKPTRVVGTHLDVTDRMTEMSRIKEQQELLTKVLEVIPYTVFWKDRYSTYMGCNGAMAKLAGLKTAADIVGKSDFDMPWTREQSEGYRAADQLVVKSGKAQLHIIETQSDALGRQLWLDTSKVPLVGHDGSIIGVLGIYADITERKVMELQLAQAHRLESIGQLASGIAHEINTPTQYVSDNVRFVQMQYTTLLGVVEQFAGMLRHPESQDEDRPGRVAAALEKADFEFMRDEIPKALSEALEGLERVTAIVRAMKDFSHPGSVNKEPADLNKAIQSTVEVARNRWKYVADLTLDLDPEMPPVPCLVAEFNQVILNLIVNAADAISESDPVQREEKGHIHVSSKRLAGCAEVRVTDNGPGIPHAVRSRIFEPFFTTKTVGKGTGQGLALSHNVVVNKHEGKLFFEDASGGGTTFVIQIPLVSTPHQLEAA